MSQANILHQRQDANTAKLVLNTFYKLATDNGLSAPEIAGHLQEKFGDVWRLTTLTAKAEEALKKTAALGFLERHGERYIGNIFREMGCCPRRRKRRSKCRRKRRRSCRRKRRRSCRRKRRRSCRRKRRRSCRRKRRRSCRRRRRSCRRRRSSSCCTCSQ